MDLVLQAIFEKKEKMKDNCLSPKILLYSVWLCVIAYEVAPLAIF